MTKRTATSAAPAADLQGIYAISPSGAVNDPQRLENAATHLARAGFALTVDRAALSRQQRFAGSDTVRLAAIERACRQKAPVVMITRGGYGLTRLLPLIDWPAVARAGKHWVGLSDFTAFHLALLAQTGAASWAGPALERIREQIGRFVIEGDLRREVTMSIKRLMDLGCYRGVRHRRGLPVRGQRTRTNARTRKGPRKAGVALKK